MRPRPVQGEARDDVDGGRFTAAMLAGLGTAHRGRIEPARSHAPCAVEVSHELASASALRAWNCALRHRGKQTAEFRMFPGSIDESGLAPAVVGDGDRLGPLRVVVQHTTLRGQHQHPAHVASNRQPARRPCRFTRKRRLSSERSIAAKSLYRVEQSSIHGQSFGSRCRSTSEPRWTRIDPSAPSVVVIPPAFWRMISPALPTLA